MTHYTEDNQWRIRLFGRLAVQRGEHTARFRTTKTGLLLACLVKDEPRRFRREELIERLWPGEPPETARNAFRMTLTFLRRVLESDPADSNRIVIAEQGEVAIHPGSFTTDKAAFEAHLLAAGHASDDLTRVRCLGAAVELYQSDFLAEYDDLWIDAERRQLADAYHAALRRLIRAYVNLRQYDTALKFGLRAVQADPYREETHRLLMQVHCAIGRPSAALRQYRELEAALQRDLDSAPSRATAELLAKLCGSTGIPLPEISPPKLPAQQPDRTDSDRPEFRLPKPLTRLIGRADTVIGVLDMLDTPETRLVTLTGMGGIGKTRVAIAAAHQLRKEGARVCYLSLAGLDDPDLVLNRIAFALHLHRRRLYGLWEIVIEAVSRAPLTLVLDNLEHLMPDIGPIVCRLLEAAPDLRCLATSRQRLGLPGEYETVVKPLPFPRSGDSVEQIRTCPSVELWVERQAAAAPRSALTEANAQDAAALCRRLEGIPLALELAAGLGGVLSPREVVNGLNAQLDLLVNRNATPDGRHTSMRTALASSFERLPAELRRFVLPLSLFVGGCTAESARAVCAEPNAAAYMVQLRDRSLLAADEAIELRMVFLETVREYLSNRLIETDDHECRLRYQNYFLQFAENARQELTGANSAEWMRRLREEEENIRAALRMMLETPETAPDALSLSVALTRYWDMRGCTSEGHGWLTRALNCAHEPTALRAAALMALGNMDLTAGHYAAADRRFRQCLEIRMELNDARGAANTLGAIGYVKWRQGELLEADTMTLRSLTAFQALSDKRGEALALGNLALIAAASGENVSAYAYFGRAVENFRSLNDLQNLMLALNNLVGPALECGDAERAARALHESLQLCGDLSAARILTLIIGNAANLARYWQEPATAVRLRAVASTLRGRLQIILPSAQTVELETELHELKLLTGEEEFAREWNTGLTLDPDHAPLLVRSLLCEHIDLSAR
jgi:predicted ATPase/DNA-binding SARP family transcriptional activator